MNDGGRYSIQSPILSNPPPTRPTCIFVLEESIFLQRSGARQTAVHWVSSDRGKAGVGAPLHYRSRTVAWVNKPASCKRGTPGQEEEEMEQEATYVGIDVVKPRVDVATLAPAATSGASITTRPASRR